MERDSVVIFRLPVKTRRALEQAAEAEDRKLSNMTLHIVTTWLRQQGYLPRPGSKSRRSTRR